MAMSTAAIFLLGLAGFLYQMQDTLRNHTQAAADYYGTPAGVGEVLWAAFCGVAAMLAGLGLNVRVLIGMFFKGER